MTGPQPGPGFFIESQQGGEVDPDLDTCLAAPVVMIASLEEVHEDVASDLVEGAGVVALEAAGEVVDTSEDGGDRSIGSWRPIMSTVP
jgi:hypothetical protein